jgi:hypothetical protein
MHLETTTALELEATELEDATLELEATELEDSTLELDSTEELDHTIVGQDVAFMQTLNRTYSWSSDSLMLERAIFASCPS